MRIFLSYSSADQDLAERLHLALIAEGHRVFFDRARLAKGDEFDSKIRAAVRTSDLVVFLASAASLRPGSYALSELQIAKERWPHPRNRMLPVLVSGHEPTALPPFLRAVTCLRPVGDAVAEVCAAVAGLVRRRRKRWLLSLTALISVAAGLTALARHLLREVPSEVDGQAEPDGAATSVRVLASERMRGPFATFVAMQAELQFELIDDQVATTDATPDSSADAEPNDLTEPDPEFLAACLVAKSPNIKENHWFACVRTADGWFASAQVAEDYTPGIMGVFGGFERTAVRVRRQWPDEVVGHATVVFTFREREQDGNLGLPVVHTESRYVVFCRRVEDGVAMIGPIETRRGSWTESIGEDAPTVLQQARGSGQGSPREELEIDLELMFTAHDEARVTGFSTDSRPKFGQRTGRVRVEPKWRFVFQ